jgi:polyisoprenoid-binding protein YceI
MVAGENGTARTLSGRDEFIGNIGPRRFSERAYVTRVRTTFTFAALLASCLAVAAVAAPRRIQLTPADSQVAFRAYGMGLLPIDANFARFGGWLVYDPDNKASCQVELNVEVASLATEDPSIRETVIGPDFMDATSFPALKYAGACQADGLHGTLMMHGVTRPFPLSLDWSADAVVAQGRLVRAEWGMTAKPLLGGRTVRITVTVPLRGLPEQGSHRPSAP